MIHKVEYFVQDCRVFEYHLRNTRCPVPSSGDQVRVDKNGHLMKGRVESFSWDLSKNEKGEPVVHTKVYLELDKGET